MLKEGVRRQARLHSARNAMQSSPRHGGSALCNFRVGSPKTPSVLLDLI